MTAIPCVTQSRFFFLLPSSPLSLSFPLSNLRTPLAIFTRPLRVARGGAQRAEAQRAAESARRSRRRVQKRTHMRHTLALVAAAVAAASPCDPPRPAQFMAQASAAKPMQNLTTEASVKVSVREEGGRRRVESRGGRGVNIAPPLFCPVGVLAVGRRCWCSPCAHRRVLCVCVYACVSVCVCASLAAPLFCRACQLAERGHRPLSRHSALSSSLPVP